ncbi:helix-turn-helix domain-containing protein [Oceanibacterium hippocampi]|uniref:Cytoskeleton protein RodZ n=1 Tax=Oceanibacterium hippocampi TaxID=745714 RepID=A0A1Y5R661_9PROT|nr:helix-turn-helix domain-containing protein [Oceanibacterium hippocampi]SLN10071.1 Cytoskeleton protein RodZ [Oceanibacterium hippocampi]
MEGPHFDGVGAQLRAVREREGISLADVAQRLRIRISQLEALEEGRYDALPGRIYVIGFLRAYARFLDLDAEQVVAFFKQETGGEGTAPSLNFPEPSSDNWSPAGWLVRISLVAAIAVFGGWYMLSQNNVALLPSVDDVPGHLARIAENPPAEESTPSDAVAEPRPAPSSTATTDTAATDEAGTTGRDMAATAQKLPPNGRSNTVSPAMAAIPEAPLTRGETPVERAEAPDPSRALAALAPPSTTLPSTPPAAPSEPASTASSAGDADDEVAPPPSVIEGSDADSLPQAEETEELVPPPPVVAANGAGGAERTLPGTYGDAHADVRVVLRARQTIWVKIQGANAEEVVDRLLKAGESYLVPNRDDLSLMASNAGALEVRVDGRVLPPLGPAGGTLRNVPLAASALLARYPADS